LTILIYWRVRARDEAGNWSNWTTFWSINVDTTPPDTPALITPGNGTATDDDKPTFDWSSVSDVTQYQLQVDNNSTFTSPEIDITTGSSVYTPGTSLVDDTYYWRVRARDEVDNWSNWSVTWTVTIDISLACKTPRTPNLEAPDNGSLTNDNTLTFSWSVANDASRYQIQVDNDASFQSPEIDMSPSSPYWYDLTGLADDIYYWRIRGIYDLDGCEIFGNWSNVWAVTIDTVPPNIPSLISPADGATTNDQTPSFDWSSVTEATQHNIQIYNSVNLSDPVIDILPIDSSYTPSSPLADGTYIWWVRAGDAAGNWGGWSSARILEIDSELVCSTPGTPSLLAPGDGSAINDSTPLFDWNAANYSNEYQLQVDNDGVFSSPEIGISTSGTAYSPSLSLTEGTYYWRVRGHNNTGICDLYGSWSSAWMTTIDITLPAVPTLISPAPFTTTNSSTPTFVWNAVLGSNSYRLQIDDNDTFTSPEVDVVANSSVHTLGTILADGTYYWRVRAKDPAGNWSNWSVDWMVIIQTQPTESYFVYLPLLIK
jgi:hypothetical protein